MNRPGSNDVLVLGGGVIGLASAWYLLESGRGVTVLDQGRSAAAARTAIAAR
jgi:D-amino-acid dehydrogenase